MNIILVNSEYPSSSGHGGIATYVYTMANALSDQKHKVFVFLRKNTMADKLNPDIELHTFDFENPKILFPSIKRVINKDIFFERGCSQSLLNLVNKLNKIHKIDIVEIPEYGGLASAFTKKNSYTLMIGFHTPSILVDKLNGHRASVKDKALYRYEARAIKCGNLLRMPSKAIFNECNHFYKLGKKKNCIIIRNPIDLASTKKIEYKNPDIDKSETTHILFAGRIEYRKGSALMLLAVKKILAINPKIQITFAGNSSASGIDFKPAIERTISDKDRDRIWFPGGLDKHKLNMLYKSSDIFLMPSVFENAPYALMEAIAFELPIIASDRGGIGEIVTNNESALLFNPDNINELISAITKMVENRNNLRTKLVKNASENLAKNFSSEIIAKEYIKIVKEFRAK